jgi:hypothetical protein
MLINIIDVGQPNTHAAKNGRSYQSIEVTYKAENGQVSNKKLMSFSNPSVFNHIKGLTKGDTLDVQTTKDAAGYWQWTGIGTGEASAAQPAAGKPQAANRVTGSNYETKEERAARQIYIVRQSSISSAIEFFNQGQSTQNVDDIIKVAKQFEDYVFAKDANPTKEINFDDMEDDIPV